MFDRLNNYLSKIKLTIEVNPSNFLDTKFAKINVVYKFSVYQNTQNYSHHGPLKLQNAINKMQSMGIIQKEHHQTLTEKSL